MNDIQSDHPDNESLYLEHQFPSESAKKAAQHYQGTFKAKTYARRISGMGTDRREKKCILKALKIAGIPAGSSVLDCPCGPGRLIPIAATRTSGMHINPTGTIVLRLFIGV